MRIHMSQHYDQSAGTDWHCIIAYQMNIYYAMLACISWLKVLVNNSVTSVCECINPFGTSPHSSRMVSLSG